MAAQTCSDRFLDKILFPQKNCWFSTHKQVTELIKKKPNKSSDNKKKYMYDANVNKKLIVREKNTNGNKVDDKEKPSVESCDSRRSFTA